MRIMVVDDSKAMRMIVMRTLKQAGFRNHDYLEAGDGVEALESIRANEPDLVLSDWNMPKMNGIELLRGMRSAGVAAKFGFVTSECTPAMRETATESGALFMIAKPFNEDTFREVLEPFIDG